MTPTLWVWLEFVGLLLVIGAAGVKLSHYGDVIATRTGMGGTFVGLVLIATVTSLPELVTGISAVMVADVPDIAVGNVLGACVMNLLLIFALDFLQRGESVYTRASHGHVLAGGFNVLILGFVSFSLLAAQHGAAPTLGHVGLYSPIILLLYLIALRTVFRYEQRQLAVASAPREAQHELGLRQAILRYVIAAIVVVAAALALPGVAEALARQMGWHQSFVGTVLVALVTTTPEIVVTIAALRRGAIDMAIGNLFGSSLFNLSILAIDDLLYLPGPLLSHVSPIHAVSAVSAIAMTGAAIIGLFYRPPGRVFKTVGWASLALFSIYLLNMSVLFLYGE